jgi:hypothetical protein
MWVKQQMLIDNVKANDVGQYSKNRTHNLRGRSLIPASLLHDSTLMLSERTTIGGRHDLFDTHL